MRAEAGSLLESFFLDHPRFDYIYIYVPMKKFKATCLLNVTLNQFKDNKKGQYYTLLRNYFAQLKKFPSVLCKCSSF